MKISTLHSNNLLRNQSSSLLKKVQINTHNDKGNRDLLAKELKILNQGKNLAKENLDNSYQLNTNKKLKESVEKKLSQLEKTKNVIENKDIKDRKSKINKTDKNIETTDEKENLLTEEEKLQLDELNKEIVGTNTYLEQIKDLDKELAKQSEFINDRITVYKEIHGNDMFKRAEKEAILKQVYDNQNNPLIKELKGTLNEIIELEDKLRDKLDSSNWYNI